MMGRIIHRQLFLQMVNSCQPVEAISGGPIMESSLAEASPISSTRAIPLLAARENTLRQTPPLREIVFSFQPMALLGTLLKQPMAVRRSSEMDDSSFNPTPMP